MGFLALIPTFLEAGKRLAAIIPGERDDRIIAIAQKYVGVIQDIVPIVRGTDQEAPANETLDELVTRIEALSERVGRKLRGEKP